MEVLGRGIGLGWMVGTEGRLVLMLKGNLEDEH